MSNIISYPGIQIIENDDLMVITDVSKEGKPLRSISIGRLAAYIEGGGGTSTSINGEDGALTFVSGNNVTIDQVGKTFTINASGGGGGGVDGSGTANKISKWSDSDTLTDSILEDDGSTLTVYGGIQNKFPFVSALDCNASGQNSMALGLTTTASGSTAVAIGNGTIASGSQSFAGGDLCQSTANRSFAFGSEARATGSDTVCFGASTRAVTPLSMSIGQQNIKNTASDNTAFVIGKASASIDPFHVDFDGNVTASGDIEAVSFKKTGGTSAQYLMADGSVTTGGGGGGGVAGSGTEGYIPVFDDATTLKDGLLFQSNLGYVGIGTGNPLAKFHIADGEFLIDRPSSGNPKSVTMTQFGYNVRDTDIDPFKAQVAIGDFSYNIAGTDYINHSYINTVGNFGIGTDSPTEYFHVVGNTLMEGELTADKFILDGGTPGQYLMADGTTSSGTGGGDSNEVAFFISRDSGTNNISMTTIGDNLGGTTFSIAEEGSITGAFIITASTPWFDASYRLTMNVNVPVYYELLDKNVIKHGFCKRISANQLQVEFFAWSSSTSELLDRSDLTVTDTSQADQDVNPFNGIDIRVKRWVQPI